MQKQIPSSQLILRFLFLVLLASCLLWCTSCAIYEAAEEAEAPVEAVMAADVPEFPWPPPQASGTEVISSEYLTRPPGQETSLGDVEREIHNALQACGYFDKSYYAVPDGFAMVTRVEQINPDGTPKEDPDRWAKEVPPLRRFSLRAIVRALFSARRGYYRIIVFIVTPHPFSQANVRVTPEEAEAWFSGGLNTLPPSIAERPWSQHYKCTALIYEFDQSQAGSEAEIRVPGRLQGRTHLVKAGLWQELTS